MFNRHKLIIIIGVAALLVLAIALFLLVRYKPAAFQKLTNVMHPTTPASTTTIEQPPVIPTEPLPTTPAPAPVTTEEAEKVGATKLAGIFIEQYFTYSTDNNYSNIQSVKSLVTPALWKKLSARLQTPPAPGPFTGVTATVLGETMTNWKPGTSGVVVVKATETTVKGTSSTAKTATINVTMTKSNGAWLVDSFTTAS